MSIIVNRNKPLTNQVKSDSHDLYNPPQMVSMDIGFIMLFLGITGVIVPTFLGLALSPMHCFVLCASAVLAIWSGYLNNRRKAFFINFALAVFFTLNALAGIILGGRADMILKVMPGFLELTSIDHVLHGVLALAFFSEAIAWRIYLRKDGPHHLRSENTAI